MLTPLLLCDFAVADLTTANANVFYELGVRHAARPATTLAIFAKGQAPPFDVTHLRALSYDLADGNRLGDGEAATLRQVLGERLVVLREEVRLNAVKDSPVFQLLEDYGPPDIARLKTDTFRDQARYSETLKRELADARGAESEPALRKIETRLGKLDGVEAGVLVDLLLSYRAVKAWARMIELYERLPATMKRTVMLREQLGFALNRAGRKDEAVKVLEEVIAEKGPSSETCGLLGRVFKDRWAEAEKAAGEAEKAGNAAEVARNKAAAAGHLKRAIETYLRGFEADWRDAYPGINAVTLLDIRGDEASLKRKDEIAPVVRYAVNQRLKSASPDYWDHATRLELAVLGKQEAKAVPDPKEIVAREQRQKRIDARRDRAAAKRRKAANKEWKAWKKSADALKGGTTDTNAPAQGSTGSLPMPGKPIDGG